MTKNRSQENAVRQYLERHLEIGLTAKEEEDTLQKYHDQLKKPYEGVSAIEYKEEGTVEYKIKDLEITFSYKQVSEQDFAYIGGPPAIDELPLIRDHDRSHWRLLTSCQLKKGVQVLDITGLINKNYRVFLHIDPNNKESAEFSSQYQAIIIPYDLRKVESILTFLHEIGHLSDYEGLKTKKDKRRWEKVSSFVNSPSKWKDYIAQERTAAAFVLRTYKPFLDDDIFGKDDIFKFTHRGLQAHSDRVKKRMVARGWQTDVDEAVKEALRLSR